MSETVQLSSTTVSEKPGETSQPHPMESSASAVNERTADTAMSGSVSSSVQESIVAAPQPVEGQEPELLAMDERVDAPDASEMPTLKHATPGQQQQEEQQPAETEPELEKKPSLSSTFGTLAECGDGSGMRSSRKRRTVERINVTVEKREITESVGRGMPLGSLPRVVARMQEFTGGKPALKRLHMLCFGVPGKKHEVKARLLRFSGLVCPPNITAEQQRAKLREKLTKLYLPLLKQMLTAADLPLAGNKV
jgi:hypothetical protein